MINFIIGGIIILLAGFVIYRIVKNRAEGKSSCAGCSGCPSAVNCASSNDAIEKP